MVSVHPDSLGNSRQSATLRAIPILLAGAATDPPPAGGGSQPAGLEDVTREEGLDERAERDERQREHEAHDGRGGEIVLAGPAHEADARGKREVDRGQLEGG